MSEEIVLAVRQDLDVDGWEDNTGSVWYDANVSTPFGMLGNLVVERSAGTVTIVATPAVILVRHGFPDAWGAEFVDGVSIGTNFAGVEVMVVDAANGRVSYQLDARPVRWSDRDDPIPFYVAHRIVSNWWKAEGSK